MADQILKANVDVRTCTCLSGCLSAGKWTKNTPFGVMNIPLVPQESKSVRINSIRYKEKSLTKAEFELMTILDLTELQDIGGRRSGECEPRERSCSM